MSRVAAALAALALGVTACAGSAGNSTSPRPSPTQTQTATPTPTPSPSATPSSPAPLLPYGQVADRSAVPWDSVGDGWFLVLVAQGARMTPTTSTPPDASVTLYLVNPVGGRYRIVVWAHWLAQPPYRPRTIEAWSPTKRQAAFVAVDAHTGPLIEEIDLATGTTHDIRLPAETTSAHVGYTLPTGANFVVMRRTAEHSYRLERWSRAGARLAEIWHGDGDSWLASPDGARYVVGGAGTRPLVVANSGGAPRLLRDAPVGCVPARWWDTTTVLMSCPSSPGSTYHRLWLVPIDRGSARPITAVVPHVEVDFGYADAVRAGGRTYLQWWGDCGAAEIRRLGTAGSAVRVSVPRALDVNHVESAYQGRLAVWSAQGCEPDVNGGWLGWYDAATGAVTPIVARPAGQIGVIGVTAFPASPRGTSAG